MFKKKVFFLSCLLVIFCIMLSSPTVQAMYEKEEYVLPKKMPMEPLKVEFSKDSLRQLTSKLEAIKTEHQELAKRFDPKSTFHQGEFVIPGFMERHRQTHCFAETLLEVLVPLRDVGPGFMITVGEIINEQQREGMEDEDEYFHLLNISYHFGSAKRERQYVDGRPYLTLGRENCELFDKCMGSSDRFELKKMVSGESWDLDDAIRSAVLTLQFLEGPYRAILKENYNARARMLRLTDLLSNNVLASRSAKDEEELTDFSAEHERLKTEFDEKEKMLKGSGEKQARERLELLEHTRQTFEKAASFVKGYVPEGVDHRNQEFLAEYCPRLLPCALW